ncbi:hypothetical protein [Lutimonas sp.]|uniref:hypothetical protein n=1 Tax=Lutimonas sp. TaxID=1872403 RepID=UPI003D9BC95D
MIKLERFNRSMQISNAKLTLSILMMTIAYNGYAQNNEKVKARSIATFSNGDEAIEIIAKTNKNVIKLSTAGDYNEFDILDLSNHEVSIQPSEKNKLMDVDSNTHYMVESADRIREEEEDDSSGV